MTDPSIRPPTNRDILAIAVPMTIGFMTTPLVGIVDMAVVGRLGDPALIGGVAIGSLVGDVVFTTCNFLRSGTTGLVSQAVGRGDRTETNAILARALLVAAVAGLLVATATPLAAWGATRVFGGSAEVRAATETYVWIRLIGAPLVLANFAIFGWLLGLGRAGAGLAVQTLLNGVNIGLAMLFVLDFGWGVAGAATAAVAADAAAFVAGLVAIRLVTRGTPRPDRARILDRSAIAATVTLNRDIMIRSFVLLGAFGFFTQQSARQGDVILAANAILEKFFLFGGYFLDGFAAAAETFVGRAVGARRRDVYDRTLVATTIWGFALAAGVSAGLHVGGGLILDLMTSTPAVRETALVYLVWAAATPLAGVLAFQMDGVFIGATWSRDMRNMMLLSILAYLAIWAVLMPVWGNHGLWIALLGFLGCRGATLALIARRRARETFATA